jgi:hypothetical protein
MDEGIIRHLHFTLKIFSVKEVEHFPEEKSGAREGKERESNNGFRGA